MGNMRVWIDTDIGTNVDDEFCLAYVARSPTLELVGVSTVFGNVELRRRIAASLLQLTDQKIPVFPGQNNPELFEKHTAVISPDFPTSLLPEKTEKEKKEKPAINRLTGQMAGHEGAVWLGTRREEILSQETTPGNLTKLCESFRAAAPDVLLSIGPLSNIALIGRDLQSHPSQLPMPRLMIMGGNIGPLPDGRKAEWNLQCDPVAAQQALHFFSPNIFIHPYGLTCNLRLFEEDLNRLIRGNPLCAMLARSARHWRTSPPIPGRSVPHAVLLHDLVPALALTHSHLLKYDKTRIIIQNDGTCALENGATNSRLATRFMARTGRKILLDTLLAPLSPS